MAWTTSCGVTLPLMSSSSIALPLAQRSVYNRVGILYPVTVPLASTRFNCLSCASDRLSTKPLPLVVRSRLRSCMRTMMPSFDFRTSHSIRQGAKRKDLSNVAMQFSGNPGLGPPRCAPSRGALPGRHRKYSCNSVGLLKEMVCVWGGWVAAHAEPSQTSATRSNLLYICIATPLNRLFRRRGTRSPELARLLFSIISLC